MRSLVFAIVFVTSCALAASAQNREMKKPEPKPDSPTPALKTTVPISEQEIAEFKQRVQIYVETRKKAQAGLPSLRKKSDSSRIEVHQQGLAAKMRLVRRTAKRGDVFFPGIVPEIKRVIKEELSGPQGAAARELMKEDKPAKVPIAVNARYPDTASRATVPPMILVRLPQLPEQLEYRILQGNLILLDTVANLIVDYIPGVAS
jgi:hypothetical protein